MRRRHLCPGVASRDGGRAGRAGGGAPARREATDAWLRRTRFRRRRKLRAFSAPSVWTADEARERGVETLLARVERPTGRGDAPTRREDAAFSLASRRRGAIRVAIVHADAARPNGGLTRCVIRRATRVATTRETFFARRPSRGGDRGARLHGRRSAPMVRSPSRLARARRRGSDRREASRRAHAARARGARGTKKQTSDASPRRARDRAAAAEGAGRGAARCGARGERRDGRGTHGRASGAPGTTARPKINAHAARAFERLKELDGRPERTEGLRPVREDDDGRATKTRGRPSARFTPLALPLGACAIVAEHAADDAGDATRRLPHAYGDGVTSYLLDVAVRGRGRGGAGQELGRGRRLRAYGAASCARRCDDVEAPSRGELPGARRDELAVKVLVGRAPSPAAAAARRRRRVARDGVGTLAETARARRRRRTPNLATRDELGGASRRDAPGQRARRDGTASSASLRSTPGMARVKPGRGSTRTSFHVTPNGRRGVAPHEHRGPAGRPPASTSPRWPAQVRCARVELELNGGGGGGRRRAASIDLVCQNDGRLVAEARGSTARRRTVLPRRSASRDRRRGQARDFKADAQWVDNRNAIPRARNNAARRARPVAQDAGASTISTPRRCGTARRRANVPPRRRGGHCAVSWSGVPRRRRAPEGWPR